MEQKRTRQVSICYTIDSDNVLTVHETAAAAAPDAVVVSAQRNLKKATANWPIARLVEVWNGFAGVVPLGDLKPVKKFTDRATALKRIWGAMRRLAENYNEEKQSRPAPKIAAASRQSRKPGVKATAATQASAAPPAAVIPAPVPKPAPGPTERKRRAGTQSAVVIALLERAGGASLEELCQATDRQKHTIRGFVSTLGKNGHRISSARREDGARMNAIEA